MVINEVKKDHGSKLVEVMRNNTKRKGNFIQKGGPHRANAIEGNIKGREKSQERPERGTKKMLLINPDHRRELIDETNGKS